MYNNSSTPTACISTAGVRELYAIQKSATSLKLGGSVSLGRAMEVFREVQFAEGFHYLESLASHWAVVANTATRNVSAVLFIIYMMTAEWIYWLQNMTIHI